MLSYKTETRPGLVALYDIRPGNGAGPFLQPRSPHGANITPTLGFWTVYFTCLWSDLKKSGTAEFSKDFTVSPTALKKLLGENCF